jgi:hypothetical protein
MYVKATFLKKKEKKNGGSCESYWCVYEAGIHILNIGFI